ncbi:MAG: orotidine-5'-phosphate decarboxylase [Pseudodesulfovibrio sp.]|uniref:Orotidine 5'-phosphate decarboxylase n=1 Tax=Pseudodesulfovibrio aespoeensis (strain ATCC 700646 / DSM 10631 / Aspo-2) TaxID=643562 RepID=E6VTN0_PSEA9|nr:MULTISPECIES: orotidine-5'-phosphate decarboxylase [Pseudodesulfovibrio]MBU4191988.1 orotidine-5'-phosphate decarboxylase [Pseudomonadota bacterium]ADU63317.1 orotidine 5'-phosphate decarboxylase [Pseudodesulfovibrio aespoeensis Aspo-2]MBU4244449.1 orotidine-5'-phosphate decarboxylase [Pseudomonadota bacterium]MBU4377760.1 orotidine-5'-phosphate decarboxylase [Pseudomonadota bacterium]MBU4474945.1 orotidine-5'-phosphate decarboxylase [Pseudomonadota bacterium]
MAELVVALDYPDGASALTMARSLRGAVPWVKVGLELFTAEGPAVVTGLKDLGFRVFLDMKFFDIPNTVRGATRSAARLGVDMVNIHALGGERMARAALEGCAEGCAEGFAKGTRADQEPPLLLAVTMLTSMAAGDLPLECAPPPSEMVLDLAVKAKQYGVNGVVCSGLEVEAVKKACGGRFICLTPGIRPASAGGDDQRRVVTPAQAVRSGSDYLVVGRPITGAASPADAALVIVEEIRSA